MRAPIFTTILLKVVRASVAIVAAQLCSSRARRRLYNFGHPLTTIRKAPFIVLLISMIAASSVCQAATMSFQAVKLGDFNRDGRSDLLFRRNIDGLLSLYLLNGFQVSPAQTIKAIGAD